MASTGRSIRLYCRLYRYDERELLGQAFTIVFPHGRRAAALRRHQQFLAVVARTTANSTS